MITLHDVLIGIYQHHWPEPLVSSDCPRTPLARRRQVGVFLLVYFAFYFGVRLALHWNAHFYVEFYKQTFLCSVTIFMTGIGLVFDRPILAQAFCVAVGFDQLLWYVDLTCYVLL